MVVEVTISRHAASDSGQDDHPNVIRCPTEGPSTKELAEVDDHTNRLRPPHRPLREHECDVQ